MIGFANCKINLGLNVIAKRDDGYHEVEMGMYPVSSFYDVVEIVDNDNGGLEYTSSGIAIDCPPEKNLCVRAYKAIAKRYKLGGVKMHLHKAVPFGGGLGGGSSDAVTVMKLLNNKFSLDIGTEEMEEIAGELGSDTVFFVKNIPALATDRGECLTPISVDLGGYYITIVLPPVSVSTAEAYSAIVPFRHEIPVADVLKMGVREWRHYLVNDFERTVFRKFPQLQDIKETLYARGATYASMSGSGSAVYGLFGSPPNLQGIFQNFVVFKL